MEDNRKFYLRLTRIILIGLLVRFLIMPFSFHGNDIFWINYSPFKFIEGAIQDPYLYASKDIANTRLSYYLPVALYLFSAFQFLFKLILPNLDKLYSVFSSWLLTWQGNTVHYADILLNQQLFRTLFVLKLPYLIFDIITGFALFQFLKEDRKKLFIGLFVWVLNPFVLQSIYAIGQMDIIIAMFIMLSVLAVKLRRPYLAVSCLSLGAAIKILPVILIAPLILILSDSWRQRAKLAAVSLAVFLVPLVPFLLLSKLAVFRLLCAQDLISSSRRNAFIISYVFLMCGLCFLKRENLDRAKAVVFSFTAVFLLYYGIYDVRLRYFVWATPLLIIIALQDKVYWRYNAAFFVSLFVLRACGNSQQWGLFAALQPEFFSSLPIMDSYLNLIVDVTYIHQVMYRLFVVLSLAMTAHIFIKNRGIFNFSPGNLYKNLCKI